MGSRISDSLPFTRRSFLASLSAAAFTCLPTPSFARVFSAAGERTPSSEPHFASGVKNRAPVGSSAFYPLPLGSVRPLGWLRRQLQVQAAGLSGHLDETWPDVGPQSGWLGGPGESWERGPYYLDGLVPLAYLLDDARLKAKAQKYIDWTLQSATRDGMFGPSSNNDWWPRMVMLKALTQYQEATSDPRVIPMLSAYFAHQYKTLPSRPLRDWGRYRWHDEALTVLWLHARTGDPQLIDLLHLLHKQGFDWQAMFADFKDTERITPQAIALKPNSMLGDRGMQTHGVNVAMALKMSPVWWLLSQSQSDRPGLQQMLAALDRYHGLPNGIFSADEHLAGRNPSQGTELCTVVEAMFSLEQSLAILGDAALGDRLERLAFNALPGTFTDDMWAHQYNQQPNQIVVSLQSKPWTTDGPESNLYGLDPNFGCCAANFHQGWPKFASSLFMLSHDDGLAAIAYAPSEVRLMLRGRRVHVEQQTEYPFRGTIRLIVNPESPLAFPLHVRIPAWASGAAVRVNGSAQPSIQPGAFARIERTWKPGDLVELTFPLQVRAERGFHDSVSLVRGALLFSLNVGEDWLKLRDRGMTADWQVYPTTPWNYALALNPDSAADSVTAQESPLGELPFSKTAAPVKLQVKAHKLPTWLSEDSVANPVPQSPVHTTAPEERITLIPYAAAKLRVTAFPVREG